MPKELNILYQFDDKYAPYAGISLLSLYENNKEIENLNVYCAAIDVSEENIRRINESAAQFNRTVTYLNCTKCMDQIHKLKLGTWNGSLATWIKMFIIEEFIGKIDSLLYLDSDTLIEGSLKDLCNFDFEEKAMACVIDSLSFEELHRLKIEKNKYYFNAGVMFFNLNYFVEHKSFYHDMILHLEKNVKNYVINDQDLLNDYFSSNIVKLSPEYNLQGIHFMYADKTYFKIYGKYDYYSRDEISMAKENKKIIHFFRAVGDYPWEEGNYHPLKREFENWKYKSLWSDIPNTTKKRTLIFRIERILYRCLPKVVFLAFFKFVSERSLTAHS